MPGSRLMSTTGPSNPSSRKVAAALPPVLPPPRITIGFVPVPSDMDDLLPKRHSAKRGTTGVPDHRCLVHCRTGTLQPLSADFHVAHWAQPLGLESGAMAGSPPR